MKIRVTRGYGLLEGLLAKKRAKKANMLIPQHCRLGKILDIGCGSHPFFLINTAFSQKFGLDQVIEVNHREIVKTENLTLLNFNIDSANSIPFDEHYFAAVTMLAVLEHLAVDHAAALVRDIYRVLSPGGVFVLTTPAPWSSAILEIMSLLRLVSPHELEEHQHAYSREQLEVLLAHSGFRKETIKIGFFEAGLNIWAMAEK